MNEKTFAAIFPILRIFAHLLVSFVGVKVQILGAECFVLFAEGDTITHQLDHS